MTTVKGTATAQYTQNHPLTIWLPSDACQLNMGIAKNAYSSSAGVEMDLKKPTHRHKGSGQQECCQNGNDFHPSTVTLSCSCNFYVCSTILLRNEVE
jgi:hypothetical protein